MLLDKFKNLNHFKLFLVLFTFVVSSCYGINVRVKKRNMPPIHSVDDLLVGFTPKSQQYKIAILTFVDQTGKAGLIIDNVADIFTTEMYKTSRFDLYDRADYKKSRSDIIKKKIEKEMEDGEVEKETLTETKEDKKVIDQYDSLIESKSVDGILLGYVTSFKIEGGKGFFEFDYRIVNAAIPGELRHSKDIKNDEKDQLLAKLKKLIVFTGVSGKIPFETNKEGTTVQISREELKKVATTIKNQFTKGFYYKDKANSVRRNDIMITNVRGNNVTINVGKKDGIFQGLVGFVITEDKNLGILNYHSKFLIVNTFDEASTAIHLDGKKPRKNAYVIMK